MSVTSDILPATTLLWRPRAGGYVLTAVAKVTVMLEPGESRLAQEQEPICEVDGHWDDNPTRSLFIPSDLVPQKPRVDVIAVGHAFAGQGKRARALVARLAVGSIDKSVEVSSDRAVGPDGTIYDAGTFARMPLVYERAAGGPGTWNPVGIQRDDRDRNGNTRLPNVQAKGLPINARVEPIGFGPIAQSWPPRAERIAYLGGALPADWAQNPLPEGFDLGFFNVAPRDQQLDALPDASKIILENLHPEHPTLTTLLPSLLPRATFEVRSSSHVASMAPDTLWIDTDRGLCTITFRAQTALDRVDEPFRIRIDLGHARRESRPPKRRNTPTDMFATENTAAGTSPTPGLPFGHGGPPGSLPTHPLLPAVDGPNWLSRVPATNAAPIPSPRQTIADGGLPWQPSATPFKPATRAQALTVQQPGLPAPSTIRGTALTPANPQPAVQLPAAAPITAPPVAPPPSPGHGAPPPQVVASQHIPLNPVARAPQPQIPQAPPSPGGFGKPAMAGVGMMGAAAMGVGAVAEADGWSARNVGGPAPTHAKGAALMGVVGASNAAADARPDGSIGTGHRKARGSAMQLLWFDPEVLTRVRRKKPWKSIIDELERGPYDAELDDGTPGETAADIEDRREVLQVLARGIPSGETAIEASLDDAVRDDGRFASPLLLVAGELSIDFDELETLKAVVSVATPLTTSDEDLKTAVDQATAYLGVPGLVSSPDVARSLTANIREAFAKGKRAVPGNYLDTESERALLDKRAYQKRNVFGGPHLRVLFYFSGSTSGVPTYLPEALGAKLPLFRRFPVRLIADVIFQTDQYETHDTALKAAAITRVIAPRSS